MIVFLLFSNILFYACPCITRKEKKKENLNSVNLIYNLLKSKRERKWGGYGRNKKRNGGRDRVKKRTGRKRERVRMKEREGGKEVKERRKSEGLRGQVGYLYVTIYM